MDALPEDVASELIEKIQEKLDPEAIQRLLSQGVDPRQIVKKPYVKAEDGPLPVTKKQYIGVKVTPENRNQLMVDLRAELIVNLQKNPDVPIDSDHLDKVCKEYILREQKHERAFNKGKETYWYKGEPYQVLYRVINPED